MKNKLLILFLLSSPVYGLEYLGSPTLPMQMVISSQTVVGSTLAVSFNGVAQDVNCISGCSGGGNTSSTFTIVNIATVTFNGVAQPVSQSGAWNLTNSTVGVVGTVTSNIGTTNGLALDATLTNGNTKVYTNNLSTITFNGTSQPVFSTNLISTYSLVNIATTTFNNISQPIFITNIVSTHSVVNVATITFNNVSQPTFSTNLISTFSVVGSTINIIPQVIGTQANAWNNVAVLSNGTSNSIDCQYVKAVSIFGNSSVKTNINIQYSQDNTNFYTVSTIALGNAGGNFGIDVRSGARYIRLQSTIASTITATIAGKQ